jgi:predicted HAD superfamily Cof-like phosphohydrolase
MQSNRQMVLEFHEEMGQPVNMIPRKEQETLFTFRLKLIEEEVGEMVREIQNLWSNIVKRNNKAAYEQTKQNLLKEVCDVMYVLEGLCVTYGWDSTEAFKRVHKSNMSKLGEKDEDGKVLKSSSYVAPDLSDLVKEEG